MQGPPLDLRMPRTESAPAGTPGIPPMLAVAIVAGVVLLVVWIALMVIHDRHAWNPDAAMTPAQVECFKAEMHDALLEGRDFDYAHCKPVMPAYAAYPFWYALLVGVAVLVIGRLIIFMHRVESRGH